MAPMIAAQIPIPFEAIAEFCRRNRIRELALFGSVLRPDFRPDSDVDVLVDFEPGVEVGLFAVIGMQDELAEMLHRPVDFVLKQGLKPLIRDSVLASALVVYAN